jgi:hypothetical protein
MPHNMPTQDETTICASNSAEWCGRVCRAHGVPGAFTPEIWFQPRVGPPYYSNAITLTRSGLAEQYAAIAQLGEALPQGFSIKDAFDRLDLTKFGFHVLFDAEWIWFQPSPVARPKSRSSLVGYDRGAELEGLHALGFRCVGPLRVWLRPDRRADS